MTSPKILVIEDDPTVARALRRALKTVSFDCDIRASVAEVRKTPESYELAIVDVNLPDGNGLDVFEELKAQSRVGSGIFFTATENEMDRIRAARCGTLVHKSDGIEAAVSQVVESLTSVQTARAL